MATDKNIFTDKETNNWFKACIALNVTKEGLSHLVETEIKHVHTAIGRSCGNCCTENIVRCPTKGVCKNSKNCNYHTQSKRPRQCPVRLCDLVVKRITSQHRYDRPSWLNTKAELWLADHWQIAQCFFPPDGYINVSSIHETDFNGVISVLLNCKHFDSCISFTIAPKPPAPECILTRARQIGRAIRHTPNCKVTDAELHDFFQTLDTLLADPKCLAQDPAATSARTKLFNLQNDRLSLIELGKLLKEANQTLIHAKEAGESFSKEAEKTLKEGLNTLEAAIQAGEKRIGNKIHDVEHRIETVTRDSIDRIHQAANEKEQEDYQRGVADLLRRLVDHYRDTVCYVPLSTLDFSLDKHVNDVYATPKIHWIKIENDGRRTKQEHILTYKDLFYRGDHLSRRTYLQGEPGSGKTTFAAKLVYDWCNVHALSTSSTKEQTAFGDVDTLHKFKFLFFISLRDSRNHTHVRHMIKTNLIHNIYAEDEYESSYKLVLKIMKTEMYLVVQDGLDEWHSEQALPSMSGIPKDQCIVLTTSRPWKLADERIKNSQIDTLFEVDGLSDTNAFNERILQCLLDDTNDIKEIVKQFQTFLENRGIESISSSPMLLTLVLCTWVDGMAERLTGSSMCEMYTTLLESLCKKANPQTCYFDQYRPSPVYCFSRTKYVKPNIDNIDAFAKAAFFFLFSNEKETSLVFSDINLSAHLSEDAKTFALDSGIISKRKGKKCYDNTSSFVHKTIQEFLAALHISSNNDVIDDVISKYLKRNEDSYLDMSQVFIFLCGFNILAANRLSSLMNEVDIDRNPNVYSCDFQQCILSGYREAVANKNTPIHLHLSRFYFSGIIDEDLIHIWKMNTLHARTLKVSGTVEHVSIRSREASTSRCQGPARVLLTELTDPGVSTRDDQEGVRTSASCMEFDLSSCNNLERLSLANGTVLPNALRGLNNLRDLQMLGDCKCEALDLSHYEHLEYIHLSQGVTLLPFSIYNYKSLQSIQIYTTYEGLDLSLFENLYQIEISTKVNILPKQVLIHNKLSYIGLFDFDFNSSDNKAIYTWCLLNGADPVQCADYTPLLASVKYILLYGVKCSSTWLRNLFSTMLTLGQRVECHLAHCNITSLEVKSRGRGSHILSSAGDAVSESYTRTHAQMTTDLNDTCVLYFARDHTFSDCPGLWETLLGLNVKNLSLEQRGSNVHRKYIRPLEVNHVSSLSMSLATLSQLETLTMHLSVYIDLELPPSLKHLDVSYNTLSPSELRHLVKKLSAWTQSFECALEFFCVKGNDECSLNKFPTEEYILNQQELEALERVEVKRFRIYYRTPNTHIWSAAAGSVRDSVVDAAAFGDDIVYDEFLSRLLSDCDNPLLNIDGISLISMLLHINFDEDQPRSN